MALWFLSRGNCYGDDLDELGSPLREQFLVAAKDGSGREFSTPLEWREVCAAEMKEGTDLQGIEIWDAHDDNATDARFRLIYFPASDSGTLFHAGTARFAGLVLWLLRLRPRTARMLWRSSAITTSTSRAVGSRARVDPIRGSRTPKEGRARESEPDATVGQNRDSL